MQSKLIHDAEGQQTYAIILATGDEVTACLTAFAREAGLQAASFKAIGAFKSARLAFFDWEAKEYLPIAVDEQVEVASLTGDVAIGPDDKPALHIHAVLGRRDGSAVAGHLLSAEVRPTLEVILTESPEYLRKKLDPNVGLALIKPEL
ncbi:PPC domain-containing DNA-binding protein [Paradevosia shaoguanensis]|uniref:DNA-binding protein n=1 Tax=Paradevosia shaoguanensis TaxID=1335043 RepID=A0AA41UB19_9HYPH|nr:PPC domain-containing DNA-binding protein [Paradevosia shaoguanensis]MCF1742535.1 DNA-binding protein [Paradevosia shaoguanensis]MCI0127018.1 DNA-binding protein [Paradevosia shaoguanensis]